MCDDCDCRLEVVKRYYCVVDHEHGVGYLNIVFQPWCSGRRFKLLDAIV